MPFLGLKTQNPGLKHLKRRKSLSGMQNQRCRCSKNQSNPGLKYRKRRKSLFGTQNQCIRSSREAQNPGLKYKKRRKSLSSAPERAESVHQIIARSTKSRTEIQEKKKSLSSAPECVRIRRNTQNTRNAPERTSSAFRLSRRLKILTVKSIFRIKYTKNCKNRSKYDGLYD